MSWLRSNAEVVEAAAAIVTALVAIAALLGVKPQLDEADRLQRLAAARDAYRSHLALAVSTPELAQPADACALLASPRANSYASFVDHLLYSAELMRETETGWDPVFLDQLAAHADYLCASGAPSGDTEAVAKLLATFRTQSCQPNVGCI